MVGWWVAAAVAAPGRFVEPEATSLWEAKDDAGGSFGWGVADLADLDGDGVRDVATGAPQQSGNAGVTVVLSGRTGAERFRHPGVAGASEGYAVADAGDVDGDGLHDVITGAPGADRALVLSGADGTVLRTLGGTAGERFGAAVGRAGDVDGDGIDDLVVGAESADGGGEDAGRVALFSGRTGAELWSVDGTEAGERLGGGTGFLGDVTGDGVPDVPVGGYGHGGRVVVLSGTDGALVQDHPDPTGGCLGQFFVSGVGDLDLDGVPDVFGGDYANPALGKATGRAHVWSGEDGHELLTLTGEEAGDGLGTGRSAGDVDGDGVPDLAVGSWRYGGGGDQAGRATVFSGRDGHVLRTVTSERAGENFGFDVIGLGDVDGDANVDLLVSAATANRVYLVGTVSTPGTTPTTDPAPEEARGCGCSTARPHAGICLVPGFLLACRHRRRPS